MGEMARLQRADAVVAIVEAIDSIVCPHPVRVAIDGAPAGGKTTLADELAVELRGRGREVIRASIEEFLRPRVERYRRGFDSPEGCYEDSFDFDQLWAQLLLPLGNGGLRRYRTQVYDKPNDVAAHSEQLTASSDAILLFDGVFLQRPELDDAWEYRVFVNVSSRESVRRARIRDADSYGSPDAAERRFRARYIPSQRRYRSDVHPAEHANVVFDNDDPSRPGLARRQT